MEAAWHRVPGGTGRVAIDLANALSRRNDIEIEGVAAWHLNPPSQNYQPSIDVQRLRCPRPLLYECWARSPRPRLKSTKHHLVHSTTIVVPPPGDVPMVVNVHDLAFRRFPERFPKRSRNSLNAPGSEYWKELTQFYAPQPPRRQISSQLVSTRTVFTSSR